MRDLVTGKRMKTVDAYTIGEIGIPSMVLMERAAWAVVCEIKKRASVHKNVWSLCGTGNNGADGVAAARMLFLDGYRTQIILAGEEEKGTREFAAQLSVARKLGIPVTSWRDVKDQSCDVLIDAVFGVGLSRSIEGDYRRCLERIKALSAPPGLTVAVDIPSGIHSDTGAVMGIALKADITVTFGWEKWGTLLYPGRSYAGEVVIDSVGFPGQALEAVCSREKEDPGRAKTCERADLFMLPERKAYSNKGTFGKVLVVAGSENMCGAAYLSGLAAYRTGAGLVKILTVEENRTILQNLLPEAILSVYRKEQLTEGREGRSVFLAMIEEQMKWADVVVLGPGLGKESYVEYLVEDILASAYVPVIIDADGINAIAVHPYLTNYFTENIILTPHLGEMSRLTGQSIEAIQADLPRAAGEYAERYGITCVLKDAATVAAVKGAYPYINSSGCSAMAKAGSGDVLTGVIAGLIAIGMEQEAAVYMGVYLHGLAGEKAAEKGSHGLLAAELADAVAIVMGEAEQKKSGGRELS